MNYTPEQRAIFRYWNGAEEVGADPLEVYRSLVGTEETDYEADAKLADMGDAEAMTRVLKVARAAFGVDRFSEKNGQAAGLLDMEVIELIKRFGEFMQDVMKKKETSPTSPAPTASATSPS